MRLLFIFACLAGVIAGGLTAKAEKRTFIIANNADGYGVDRCLASGQACGRAVATAYCRTQAFARALSFGKIDRGEITGAIPAGTTSCRGSCDDLVAIECSR